MTIHIQPMQWSVLRDLDDVPEIDRSDEACLAEIRAVLERHGKLARFALHLAHRHFDLKDGEILIERPDPDGRTQHVTVGRREDEPKARITTWLMVKEEFPDNGTGGVPEGAVYCVCASGPSGAGCVRHVRSRSAPEHVQERINAEKPRLKTWKDYIRERQEREHEIE